MANRFNFRAWDRQNQRMVDLKKITPLALTAGFDVDGIFIPFTDDLILMQSTGLVDKDGKEVFEGDVVHSAHNDTQSEIRFGLFNQITDDGDDDIAVGFYFLEREGDPDEGCSFGYDIHGNTDAFTVVGNIYEKQYERNTNDSAT